MAHVERSDIGWTDYSAGDANFVLRGKRRGDCEVSTGCENCYAYRGRNRDPRRTPDYTTYSAAKLTQLRDWQPEGEFRRGPDSRPMAFVVDYGDLFHPRVPDSFIRRAFAILSDNIWVDFQILTKRIERAAELLDGVRLPGNVWVGATCESQRWADVRLPYLRKIDAAVRFVSVEPMLEPVRLDLDGVQWVICGGESGPGRRPFDKRWADDLRRQCAAAGVAYFFKQGSAYSQGQDCTLGGREYKAWPRTAPVLAQAAMF